jgi:maltose alpha-D-glucosyltransferase/alpha-amylase
VAKAYYWHRFYSHQPDLNYASRDVRRSILGVVDFWFGMGVDGLRLDAIPYLYEREGTSCENLPETHAFLKELRAHVDGHFKNRLLIAEANQWPEDAAAYFGNGDEAHMAYHFPLMPRLFMALRMENSYPIIDILNATPQIPDNCQWGLFLRNHDELTLEMVTDEERDYMYQVYAKDPHQRVNLGIRRRLAPLMRDDRREMELMNAILFSLPGTVILYYGDEIGMGDNYYLGDRNSVRTPMQWSADKNAGFSTANPQQLYLPIIIDPEYHYEAVNVEVQQLNPSSFLWWIKRLIRVARKFRAFSRGGIRFLVTNNNKVLAFIRNYQEEHILVVFNLSKTPQFVSLDLSVYAGSVPRELFSQNKFPKVTKNPYIITLGSHDYFWLLLPKSRTGTDTIRFRDIPSLVLSENCRDFIGCKKRGQIEEILVDYLNKWPGFGLTSPSIRRAVILEQILMTKDPARNKFLILVEVTYTDGLSEVFFLPVMFSTGKTADLFLLEVPQVVIMHLTLGREKGILHESIYDPAFRNLLLGFATERMRLAGKTGTLASHRVKKNHGISENNGGKMPSQLFTRNPLFSLVAYTDSKALKIYNRVNEGTNPDKEILEFLNQNSLFPHCPVLLGSLEFQMPGATPITLGLLEENTTGQTTALMFVEDTLEKFYERVLSRKGNPEKIALYSAAPSGGSSPKTGETPDHIDHFFLDMIRLLGKRTAELHKALSSSTTNPDFMPEQFSRLYQRSVFQSFQSLTRQTMWLIEMNSSIINPEHRHDLKEILELEPDIITCLERFTQRKISTIKMRIHGDYHLGQVLYTGKDFIIANFEGDATRMASERRLKYCPFRDVAGMIWSLHYAAWAILMRNATLGPDETKLLEPWAEFWCRYVSQVFLAGYLETAGTTGFVPEKQEDYRILINTYLLERAVSKTGFILNQYPKRVNIAFRVMKSIVEEVQ